MVIIAVDIDDCLLPNDEFYNKDNANYLTLKRNLVKIIHLIDDIRGVYKGEVKVAISSTWGLSLTITEDNKLALKDNKENDSLMLPVINCINHFIRSSLLSLKDYPNKIMGSAGLESRIRMMSAFLDKGHIVLALDDMDLSSLAHSNFLFLKVCNKLTFEHIKDATFFISSIKEVKRI